MPALPVLGILGGGQLGRMTAFAALRMGIHTRFLVPEKTGSVMPFSDVTVGDWNRSDLLRDFARGCSAVTVESEWAPADKLADVLPDGVGLWPGPDTLKTIRDKAVQKATLAKAGLPMPAYRVCTSEAELSAAADALGLPLMLKRRRGSYDGYGNHTCRNHADLEVGWNRLAQDDGLVAEAWVDFEAELSVIVARTPFGKTALYPVFYTEQRDHRCHAVVLPSGFPPEVEREAEKIALGAVEAVNGVGVTAVEMFLTKSGKVLVNELAPRPHNTGHVTIEACHTSQFENHARAVLGLPLGYPGLCVPAACMINVLGRRKGHVHNEGLSDALAVPGAAVHLYGKRSVSPRRKMGHVTATSTTPEDARARAEKAAALIQL